MSFESVGIPVLALIVGFISLLINHHEKNKKILVGLLVVGLVATCALGVVSNISADKKSGKQGTKIDELSKDNSKLINVLSEFKNNTEVGLEDILTKLDSWFINPNQISIAKIKESVQADQQLKLLATKMSVITNTKIKYYVKEVDNQLVIDALASKGMSVDKGKANLENDKTNAIWFGGEVSLDEVKYVALTLIRAGVDIRTIKPYSSEGRKINIIEIGSDRQGINKPIYSVTKIESASTFTRND